jgi:hypothetical protein
MSFESGFSAGVMQSQRRTEQKRADAIRAEEAPMREVENRLRETRLGALRADLEFETKARERDVADYTRAEAAFGNFQKMTDAMDWSRPDSLKQYQSLQKQFVPEITRHKSVLGKFTAYNQAVMASQDFTDKMTMATQLADMRKQLVNAGYGAEAMGIGKSVERGEKTMEEAITEFSELLRSNKLAETEAAQARAVELRRASVDARVEGELAGAYGGTSRGERGEKIDELTKMEAKGLLDRIAKADEKLRALPLNQTDMREAALRELNAAKVEYRKLKQSVGQPAAPRAAETPAPAKTVTPAADDKVVVEKGGKRFRLPRRQLEQAQQEGYTLIQ